MFEYID